DRGECGACVHALCQEDRQRHRRATIDALMAMDQDLRVRVGQGGEGVVDTCVEPLVWHPLTVVRLTVEQVSDACGLRGSLVALPLGPAIDDMSNSDWLGLCQEADH